MKTYYMHSLMKKSMLFLAVALAGGTAFAQDTRTTRMSESLTEVYSYLPGDKKMKEGICKVLDENNNVLAMGYYRQNRKAGVWNYYNPKGIVVQQYDYAKNALLSNNNYDGGSIVHYNYDIPGETIAQGAKVEPPVKVGGINYGFFLLYETRQIPKDLKNDNTMLNAAMSYEFTIGPDGKLEKWDISYLDETTDKEIRKESQSVKHLPEDAYTFVAAKVDGKPVRSKLIYIIPLKIKESNSQRVGDSHYIMKTGN